VAASKQILSHKKKMLPLTETTPQRRIHQKPEGRFSHLKHMVYCFCLNQATKEDLPN